MSWPPERFKVAHIFDVDQQLKLSGVVEACSCRLGGNDSLQILRIHNMSCSKTYGWSLLPYHCGALPADCTTGTGKLR